MSKMPAKKKSCFQITSVTQAQVAASSNTDDTESLDDPDESRTEDLSSEIFDVSRADLGVCDRSSSEETLNSVETQEGQAANSTGPVNGGFSVKALGAGSGVPLPTTNKTSIHSSTTQSITAASTVPAVAVPVSVTHAAQVGTGAMSTASCSSRFRVIKLDHGTGEPFRRGRWTCTEFYERDSEGSGIGRTVDSIKHVVTLDHNVDRDSGLGATGSSVVVPSAISAQVQEPAADSGYLVTHHSQPPETLQHGYVVAPTIGSGASAFQPTGYSNAASQQPQQAQVNMQPLAPQTLQPSGLNGAFPGAMLQKSPIIPPATQSQDFAYFSHPAGPSASQPEYRQQHFVPHPPQVSSTPNPPTASLTVGPPATQGLSSVINQGGSGTQGLGMVAQGGQAASAQGLLLQAGSRITIISTLPGSVHQEPVSQLQPSGVVSSGPAPAVTTTTAPNVPATPPNAISTLSGISGQAPGTGGVSLAPGARRGATTALLSSFSNPTEESRRKSDVLPQPSTGALPGKDGIMASFIPESLNLPTPTVNSLFGIPIPMDGEEDRNPSTAFYQAFPSSRLRGSKPLDSTSGASVVAIDNKIEQAMDLVKSHLMYAVREEVEVLKEQIKELYERNSVLERENAVLKSLANTEQLHKLSSQISPTGSTSPPQQQQITTTNNTNVALPHHEGGPNPPHQPNVTSA